MHVRRSVMASRFPTWRCGCGPGDAAADRQRWRDDIADLAAVLADARQARRRRSPIGDGWLYEPKWDGFRCIVFRDGDEIELASRNERPFTRYFPELLEPLRGVAARACVVDGEIVVAAGDGHGLDFDALLQRIHPAESRVDRLAAETPAVFVAFDLLAARRRTCSTRRSSSAGAGCASALRRRRRRRSTSRRRTHRRRRRRADWFARVRGRRARRRRRQAPRRPVHAGQAHAGQGQAPAHRRLRRRRLPRPQGRQGRRLAAARPVRRRRPAAPRRRGRRRSPPSSAPSCSTSWRR